MASGSCRKCGHGLGRADIRAAEVALAQEKQHWTASPAWGPGCDLHVKGIPGAESTAARGLGDG